MERDILTEMTEAVDELCKSSGIHDELTRQRMIVAALKGSELTSDYFAKVFSR